MSSDDPNKQDDSEDSKVDDTSPAVEVRPKEVGGRGGLEPTRYGDWEKAGRCVDF
jgi:hypothetical protein